MTFDQNIDFLVSDYGECDFIINRSNISGSVSYKSNHGVIDKYNVVEYGEERLLLFDLDRFFSDYFIIKNMNSNKEISSSKIVLIVEIDRFNTNVKENMISLLDSISNSLCTGKIAILISSHTTVLNIDLACLKLLPKVLKSSYKKKGILAVRFAEGSRLQYFVDIERILSNQFLRKEIV